MRIPLTLFAFSLALAPRSEAQQFLTISSDGFVVVTDVSAGGLVLNDLIDVAGTASPPPQLDLFDATVVDDEIWVSTYLYVYRYDSTTLAFIGAIPINTEGVRGITVIGNSAWVAARSQLLEFTFDGVLLASYPTGGASDVIEFNGNLLVSNEVADTLDLFDTSGNFLGVFTAPVNLGVPFVPGQLARGAGGSILVAGIARVFEFDQAGTLRGVYQGAIFEKGVQETSTGDLLVAGLMPGFLERKTQQLITMAGQRVNGYLSPYTSGTSRYARVCSTTPNSVGPGSHVSAIGHPSESSSLRLLADDAVPGQIGYWLYGIKAGLSPFGDGTLCIDPSGGVHRLPPRLVEPNGLSDTSVDFQLPPFAGFGAGTGLIFQLVYRDPGGATGFNASDAVRVTLLP